MISRILRLSSPLLRLSLRPRIPNNFLAAKRAPTSTLAFHFSMCCRRHSREADKTSAGATSSTVRNASNINQDTIKGMSKPLTKEAAEQRFKQLKPEPIQYTFYIKLGKEGYEGIAESNFQVVDKSQDLFFDYTGKEVTQLIINQKKVDKVDYDKSFLKLPKDSLQEGPNNVIVQFKTKYDNDGQGCVSFVDVDGKQYVYTQFEPYAANRVWPIFDQPDLKGKMTLNITAPKEWKVLSNERPTQQGDWNAEEFAKTLKSSDAELVKKFMSDSQGQMVLYPETKVLPNYLFCFVAGQYSELACPNPYKGMPMSLYCIDSLLEYLKKLAPFVWEVTIEAMKFYESFFGYPFSFNQYEQIFAHEYKWGAMENAGIVTFNDDYVFKEKVSDEKLFDLADTITHELAHHWFGNLVTMKWWDDLWLNESFADYISYFCLEKIKDKITTLKYDSSFASFNTRKGWGYAEDQMVTTHPIRGPVPNTEVAESIFDGITYSKGASTMKQLMFVMKEENFSKALSEYFHKYEWKNTVLDDFIACMQHHFKNEHFTLDDWKKVWLETACLNQIEPIWDPANKDKEAKLTIKQSAVLPQHPTLRMHNIRVAFFKENCEVDQVETWVVPKEESTVTYDGSKNYKAVLLNYEDWSFVKHILDPHSLQFFTTNLCKVPDILSRALIWKSFFDMVKDSKITSTKYLQLFQNNIANESYDSVFEKQFDLVHSAISAYTPLKYRDSMNDSLFYFTLWLLKTTPKDKANRLVVLRNKLILFASTHQTKKIVVQWWNDRFEPLRDHPMTVGQQWSAVVKAHSLKYYSEQQKKEIFERQAKADTSDTQKGKKMTCEALTANREQFEKLYESYKDPNNDMATSLKKASMQGFNSTVHLEWIEKDYAKRFFDDLPKVSEALNPDAAILFLDTLQPCTDNLADLIKGYKDAIPKLDKFERVATEAKMNLDILERRLKAYQFFESQQPK